LLAGLLLTNKREWAILCAAVLPVHLLIQLTRGVSFENSAGWYVTNVSEALVGAFCVRYFCDRDNVFDTFRGTVIYIAFGVFVAPFLTSFLDAAVVVTTTAGRDYRMVWNDRFFSNMLSNLTVTPPAVALISSWRERKLRWDRSAESILIAVLIFAIATVVFRNQLVVSRPAILYLLLPILLWAAVRFGSAGTSASLLLLATICLWDASHARGPFVNQVRSLQIFLAIVIIPLLCLGAVLEERRAVITDLKRAKEMLSNFSGKLIIAQENERRRIARELHDDIGQRVALLAIELEKAEDVDVDLHKLAAEALFKTKELAISLRDISHNLHSTGLDILPLPVALKALCATYRDEKALNAEFLERNVPDFIHADAKLCFYRIAQEALQNAAKHSGANSVLVSLVGEEAKLRLRVADDGAGFDAAEESGLGMGLSSMRERIKALGGTLTIQSAAGEGTRVEASLSPRSTTGRGSLEAAA
jgi:signal transduction histidine kinase